MQTIAHIQKKVGQCKMEKESEVDEGNESAMDDKSLFKKLEFICCYLFLKCRLIKRPRKKYSEGRKNRILEGLDGLSNYKPKEPINRKTLQRWKRQRRLNIPNKKLGRHLFIIFYLLTYF